MLAVQCLFMQRCMQCTVQLSSVGGGHDMWGTPLECAKMIVDVMQCSANLSVLMHVTRDPMYYPGFRVNPAIDCHHMQLSDELLPIRGSIIRVDIQ